MEALKTIKQKICSHEYVQGVNDKGLTVRTCKKCGKAQFLAKVYVWKDMPEGK